MTPSPQISPHHMNPPIVSIFVGLVTAIALMPVSVKAAEVKVLEEVPEEVLRSEILLDGRSSFTGERLSATEYAEMQSEIEQTNTVEPQVSPKLRTLVGLVKLRKFIKTVLPIVPIK
jgi:hypothetical protein